MKNYTINWEKITVAEAQEIADLLATTFNVIATGFTRDEKKVDIDVLSLVVAGEYDDNLHVHELQDILSRKAQ